MSINTINGWRRVPAIVAANIWFKFFGAPAFIAVFFAVYIFLLHHPAYPVTIIPPLWLDNLIGIQPWTLPFYLSLWFYVSLPPLLMTTKSAIVEYGLWMGGLCITALTIFYFWPTAVGPVETDWAQYPGMAFLKSMDAAGNACPSLHVATAVFSWLWLRKYLPALGLGRLTDYLLTVWCAIIVYSTMATKQHMALDVLAGIILSLVFFLAFVRVRRNHPFSPASSI